MNAHLTRYPAPVTDAARHDAFQAELTAWALAYAARGWPVFPAALINGQKRPLVAIGRAPEHGALASINPDQIRDWWQRWPLAMIGVVTGHRSGLAVLDVDVKPDRNGFVELAQRGIAIPADTIEVVTPSGGRHFWFGMPASDLRSSAGKVAPGVDIRANGGVIMMPPSKPSFNGADYHFAPGQEIAMGGHRHD